MSVQEIKANGMSHTAPFSLSPEQPKRKTKTHHNYNQRIRQRNGSRCGHTLLCSLLSISPAFVYRIVGHGFSHHMLLETPGSRLVRFRHVHVFPLAYVLVNRAIKENALKARTHSRYSVCTVAVFDSSTLFLVFMGTHLSVGAVGKNSAQ